MVISNPLKNELTEVPATDVTGHELSSVAGAGSSCLELIHLEQLSLSYIFFLNKLNGYQIRKTKSFSENDLQNFLLGVSWGDENKMNAVSAVLFG